MLRSFLCHGCRAFAAHTCGFHPLTRPGLLPVQALRCPVLHRQISGKTTGDIARDATSPHICLDRLTYTPVAGKQIIKRGNVGFRSAHGPSSRAFHATSHLEKRSALDQDSLESKKGSSKTTHDSDDHGALANPTVAKVSTRMASSEGTPSSSPKPSKVARSLTSSTKNHETKAYIARTKQTIDDLNKKLRRIAKEARSIRKRWSRSRALAKVPRTQGMRVPLRRVAVRDKRNLRKQVGTVRRVMRRAASSSPIVSSGLRGWPADTRILTHERTLEEALSGSYQGSTVQKFNTQDVELEVIDEATGPVPKLAHGLQRVLFNRGVVQFRDLHSRVYNFDPGLEIIPPLDKVDFGTLTNFTPPSKDMNLRSIAENSQKKYLASTSSMTGMLKHMHFLLSGFRGLNFRGLSHCNENPETFTKITKGPEAVFLKYNDGIYAVDADKEFDSANVLSMMGRLLEKYFTADKSSFEKYKAGKVPRQRSEDEPGEAYHYSVVDDFLLRSQLDAHDPRLPGSGMFDLKTRAVLPIRMDSENFEPGMDYELHALQGQYGSFEREFSDMSRSTMLKYSLQARIGRMDGIFVAYHNIARIFGFQYISINEMDLVLHGQEDRSLGDQEFRASLRLLNQLFNRATERFPGQSLRIHMEAPPQTEKRGPTLYFFAEPVSPEQIESIQTATKTAIEEWEREMLGLPSDTTASEEDAQASSMEESSDGESIFLNLSEDSEKFRERARQMQEARVSKRREAALAAVAAASSLISETSADPPTTSDGGDVATNGAAKEAASTEVPSKSKSRKATASEAEAAARPPLIALSLKTKNRINGRYRAKPTEINAQTRWEVEYLIEELPPSKSRDLLYQQIMKRRRTLLHEDIMKKRNADARGAEDFFKRMMAKASREGRHWRFERDALDKEKEWKDQGVFVWDREEPIKRGEYVPAAQS